VEDEKATIWLSSKKGGPERGESNAGLRRRNREAKTKRIWVELKRGKKKFGCSRPNRKKGSELGSN